MFNPLYINKAILSERAFNLRWAELPADVIPLTAADPDYPCAFPITDAIQRFIKDRYLSYGPPAGYASFKEAMAAFLQTKRSVITCPQSILPVDSAAFGIYLTCKSMLLPGDEAIIFNPVDFLFRSSIEQVGATAISFPIPAGTDRVDFSQMEELITPKTKMVCLCNPLNPTGKVFKKEELEELAAICEKHDLIILSDEIWSDIIFEPYSYTSIAALNEASRNRTVIVTGFSKSYGLAGLRIGAVIAPNPTIFEKIYEQSLHNTTIHGANIIGQIAATAALNECGPWLEGFLKHLNQMRNLIVPTLNEIPGFKCIAPEGCYVAFIDIRGTGKDSSFIHEHLMRDAKVAVVPGLPKWFGSEAEGYIRISFATSEVTLEEALYRIRKSIHTL